MASRSVLPDPKVRSFFGRVGSVFEYTHWYSFESEIALHGRAALVENSTNWLKFSTIWLRIQPKWLKIQPKAKIQNKNDVIIIQSKKMICASIKSELIL